MELREQAVSGMLWVFIDYFLVKGVSFLGTIYLTRLLSPEDFGLIAMISIFMTIGTILLDGGLSSSLIRNSSNDQSDFSTVFYTNLAFGAVIYILLFSLAPLIARFFEQEILTKVIRVYSVVFFLTSLSSVQMTILIKEMKFKMMAFLNIPSVLLGIAIGIWMGINGYGVWSIVAMFLVNQVVLTLLLWVTSTWKPILVFSKNKFRYHIDFGYKLVLANLLGGTTTNIYNSVAGKFYSLNTAGAFERAFTLNNYPLMILTRIFGKVSFPLLVTVKEESERFKTIFKKLIGVAFFINAPLMLILSASAEPLIDVVLGKNWLVAVPIFRILCFGGVFYTLQALNVNTIQTFGKTNYVLKGEIFLKIILMITVAIALFFGFEYFLWSIVLNSLFTLLVNMFYCSKVIDVTLKDQVILILPVFLISLISYLVVTVLLQAQGIADLNSFIKLVIAILVGSTVFLGFSFLFKIDSMFQLLSLIKENIRR